MSDIKKKHKTVLHFFFLQFILCITFNHLSKTQISLTEFPALYLLCASISGKTFKYGK